MLIENVYGLGAFLVSRLKLSHMEMWVELDYRPKVELTK